MFYFKILHKLSQLGHVASANGQHRVTVIWDRCRHLGGRWCVQNGQYGMTWRQRRHKKHVRNPKLGDRSSSTALTVHSLFSLKKVSRFKGLKSRVLSTHTRRQKNPWSWGSASERFRNFRIEIHTVELFWMDIFLAFWIHFATRAHAFAAFLTKQNKPQVASRLCLQFIKWACQDLLLKSYCYRFIWVFCLLTSQIRSVVYLHSLVSTMSSDWRNSPRTPGHSGNRQTMGTRKSTVT